MFYYIVIGILTMGLLIFLHVSLGAFRKIKQLQLEVYMLKKIIEVGTKTNDQINSGESIRDNEGLPTGSPTI